MKKIVSILLVVCSLVCLSACGDNKKTSNQASNQKPTQQATQKPVQTENSYQYSHTHYYTSKVTKEATCGKEGVKTYTCSCGDSYTEAIEKTGYHSWEYATCTKPKTCKVCGTTSGSANGHSYGSWGICYYCDAIDPAVASAKAKCSLELPALPKTVSYYGYSNKLYSTTKLTKITYEFTIDENANAYKIEVFFSGEKTYDYQGSGQSDSCKIGYKLYAPDGSVMKTGTFYSPSLKDGETFSNKKETIYLDDGSPVGKYKLEILDVN